MKKNIFFIMSIIFFIVLSIEGCGENDLHPPSLTPQNNSYNGDTLLALPAKIDIISKSIEVQKVVDLPNELLCMANKLFISDSLKDTYIGSMNLKECFLKVDYKVDYKVSLNREIYPQLVAIYLTSNNTNIIIPKEIVYKIGRASSENSWGSFNIDVTYNNDATAKYIFRDTIARFAQSSIVGSYSFSYKGILNDLTATLSKSTFFSIIAKDNTGKNIQNIISSSSTNPDVILTSTKITLSNNNEKLITEIQTKNKDNGNIKIVKKIINKSETNNSSIEIISQNIDINNNIIETNIENKDLTEILNIHFTKIKKEDIESIKGESEKLFESFTVPIVEKKIAVDKPSDTNSSKSKNKNTISVTVIVS